MHGLLIMTVFRPFPFSNYSLIWMFPSGLMPHHSSCNSATCVNPCVDSASHYPNLSASFQLATDCVRLLKIDYAGFMPHNQIPAC